MGYVSRSRRVPGWGFFDGSICRPEQNLDEISEGIKLDLQCRVAAKGGPIACR